ncbi:MAG: hypothetical protein H6727_19065 [Myxococcales bacterium]|nr:hypothetical protein [Myxococcales bacterium]
MNQRVYIFVWLVCWILLGLPFLSVTFTPIIDLPQQVGQIRLWIDLHSSSSPTGLVSVWWYPNHLSYVFLGVGWWLVGPLYAGVLGMWLVAGVWLAGLFRLAWRFERSYWVPAILGLLFYHVSMYWGFYNFLVGQAAFFFALAWWFAPVSEKPWWFRVLEGVFWSFLLYSCHTLWLGVAMLCFGIGCLWRWKSWKQWGWNILGTLPILALTLVWVRSVRAWYDAAGDNAPIFPTLWGDSWYQRLLPSFWQPLSLGGLVGPVEALIFWALVAWLVLGSVISKFVDRRKRVDGGDAEAKGESEAQWSLVPKLWGVAMIFLLLGLFLPEMHERVMFLARRWLPVAVVLGLLAFPGPRVRGRLSALVCVFLYVGFLGHTIFVWRLIEKHEFSGLREAIHALPQNPGRVLGADLYQKSRFIREERPFMNVSSYSQVLKGAELDFSFIEIPSGLVFHKIWYLNPWTISLNWRPHRLKDSDLKHFSYVLVSGVPKRQLYYALLWRLKPITTKGMWRLYKVSSQP